MDAPPNKRSKGDPPTVDYFRNTTDMTTSSGLKTKPCMKFFSTSGCPYGDTCHFLHYVHGGVNPLGLTALANLTAGGGTFPVNLPPTGMSPTLPVAELQPPSSGYKTRLCNKYDTPEGCWYGSKCHFAHGQCELRTCLPSSSGVTLYNSDLDSAAGAVPGSGLGSIVVSKMSIDGSLAGAIIGKGGVNVKQIYQLTGVKICVRDHETEVRMKSVELEGPSEQVEQASQLVQKLLTHKDSLVKPVGYGSHNYKTKLCDKFTQGTCSFGDRCHFAHGISELRDASTRSLSS